MVITDNDRPLTLDEAAKFLSISTWQVAKYCRQGILKAYKMGDGTGKGSRWRIWRRDLVEFLEKGSNVKQGG